MLYPLKFKPVYKQIIWGGTYIIKRYNRQVPFDRVAESWELCCRPDGMGIVENGFLAGRSFDSLIAEYKEMLLGAHSTADYGNRFPLLIKLIDAEQRLSVQVHPNDAYAVSEGEPNGKNEMWYIIDAKKDAKIIYGLKKGVTKQDYINAVASGKIEETLCEVAVKPGDCVYIPAGTVHAILEGIQIAEIQQNSNTTYRIYDWGRLDELGRGRELNTEKALESINFDMSKNAFTSVPEVYENYIKKILLRSKYFNVDEVTVSKSFRGKADGNSFIALLNLEGSGTLSYSDGEINIYEGETLLIPACLGDFKLSAGLKLLMADIKTAQP